MIDIFRNDDEVLRVELQYSWRKRSRMGSEGVQISIPDFDDDGDDFNAKPVFGRSGGASLWGDVTSSGLDSPGILTPMGQERNERSYFHSRGDSATSEDSSHSVQLSARKLKTPFVHSAQSSVATTSGSPFGKKSSFASLRNAFKSSKSSEPAPPVPALDQQAYPALKNPFNRSTSSLAHVVGTPKPTSYMSPSSARPSTPASGESRIRGTPKNKVPPVPNVFGHAMTGSEPLSPPDFEEKNTPEAHTPSDFALHAIFIRFATAADSLIHKYISQPVDRDPLLETFMGPGVDANFDGILRSFEKIAQKHAQKVVESIRRWPKAQIHGNTSSRTPFAKPSRNFDSSSLLTERKTLASVYIMCRALIAATQSMTKDSLSDAVGNSLEEFTFEQFRRPDIKMLTHSVNHRAIADLYAALLGNLANVRFESVTDRFISELGPIAAGQIKVWPTESFEEGAEFLESLSKSFENAHGLRLKNIFAEALVQILHPIAQHPEGTFAYPQHLAPHVTVLQTCFQAWPRCLHPSISVETVLDMLIRGMVHIEPSVNEAASQALIRFMASPTHGPTVLSRFYNFLCDPQRISGDGSSLRLAIECARLVNLWTVLLDRWVDSNLQIPRQEVTPQDRMAIATRFEEAEVVALFLLSHASRTIQRCGVKAIRKLGILIAYVFPETTSPTLETPPPTFRITEALLGEIPPDEYLNGSEDVLDPDEVVRLSHWRTAGKPDTILLIAESDDPADRSLWKHTFSSFMQVCIEQNSATLALYRDMLKAAVTRYHPYILHVSGVKPSSSISGKQGSAGDKTTESRIAAHQWFIWLHIMCATAQVPETRPGLGQSSRDHSRARSEAVNVERADFSSSRDLFKYLSQYLDSDHSGIRDAAVLCISSLPAYGYSHLLDDLSVLAARQIFDDPRVKSASMSTPMLGRARRQERFQTAVARIYYLTAHLIQEQRSSGRQMALTHVLKYVRNMQSTLGAPETRDAFSMQRLRRYFCGTVERLFDGLATLNDSDRFIPAGMHLALYRMCEEWCQLGKQADHVKRRLVVMQTAAAKSYQDPAGQAELIQRFQTETRALSHAAVGAMASLVQKAFFPPEVTASPVDKSASDAKPLEASAVLDRIMAILASFHENVQSCGKKALRSLLLHTPYSSTFADEVLRRTLVTTKDLATSNFRFFESVADVVCNAQHGFKFGQVVCLGLSNLCHPLVEVRRKAFAMLDIIHEQDDGIISLDQYEAAVDSSAPSTYLHAHRLISDVLSGEHPEQALNVLAHFAEWIPRGFDIRSERASFTLIMLQSLEFWVPHINLMVDDRSGLSSAGRSSIYHLVALTLRYAESHAEQISVLWSRIVDAPYQSNGHAVVRFLLEQSHKVGSTIFISCAAKIVACLSHSVVGKQLFEELCSVVEPARMLPSIEHKLIFPDAEDMEMWSDLDVLFSEQPRLSLGVAQFSLLFLSDAVMDRCWQYQAQMPVLLHAIFMHLDHKQSYIKERARHMLFQFLRACVSGYDELMDRSMYASRADLKAAISGLERDIESILWKEDDMGNQAEPKMRWLVTQVLDLLEPLHSGLAVAWGSLSLQWGTSCSIRPIAFRSLQFYRALMTKITKADLGMLLGRLANTIADEDTGIQEFNVEILLTLSAMSTSSDLDVSMVPQLFWSALACLSTTVEAEFLHVVGLIDVLLDRIDLDEPRTTDALISQQPLEWKGAFSMQSALLTGLRSSVTLDATCKLLHRLTKVHDSRLIDPSEGRVRDLYTFCLPWCIQGMMNDSIDEHLLELATNIGRLADLEERPSITRIMTSFVKSRFRTNDDFLRQSIASLREHYGKEHWTEVVTLLVGLVLNQERWLRVHTLQIIKVLFQQRETRAPMDLLGSELLMPLLRLLDTDLAPQVLEVLEEPLQVSGGPAAKHILRMSLHRHLATNQEEVEDVAEVFGMAKDSGWCVPRVSLLRDICRYNMVAVFDTCKVPSRPSRIDFHVEDPETFGKDSLDNLGDLVQNLHELTSFFEDVRTPGTSVPARQLEARVAAILTKSSDTTSEPPQTPSVDIFDLSFTSYEDFEGSSASDSDSDLFEFDSPHPSRH
ncbi:hypothetical protein EUX98_g1631 [Antrodiella citrinella]|uniref:Cell morphogenesis protein N-terminal domain-containing protein n=1 Tax=Antrodiella citrinella TaxID=2447956 RepID=A0A4S4N0Z8_9APHY|nr:hypothetical protein EUX98_g1631 [Antrodiella citrinella]